MTSRYLAERVSASCGQRCTALPRSVAVVTVLLTCAIAAPVAHAGVATLMDPSGRDPHVVIDDQVAAHVAWLKPDPTHNAAFVCRMPVGGACPSPQRLPMPSDAASTQVGWTSVLPVMAGPHAADVDVVLPESVGSRVFVSTAAATSAITGAPALVHTDYREGARAA